MTERVGCQKSDLDLQIDLGIDPSLTGCRRIRNRVAADLDALVSDGEASVTCCCRQDNWCCSMGERRKSTIDGSGESAHQKGASPNRRPLLTRTQSKHGTVSTLDNSRSYSPAVDTVPGQGRYC